MVGVVSVYFLRTTQSTITTLKMINVVLVDFLITTGTRK